MVRKILNFRIQSFSNKILGLQQFFYFLKLKNSNHCLLMDFIRKLIKDVLESINSITQRCFPLLRLLIVVLWFIGNVSTTLNSALVTLMRFKRSKSQKTIFLFYQSVGIISQIVGNFYLEKFRTKIKILMQLITHQWTLWAIFTNLIARPLPF